MKKRVKVTNKQTGRIIPVLKQLVTSLVTALIGFAAGWIFDNHIILSIIVFSIMALLTLVAWIITVLYEKKVSILEILNDDIKHRRYQEAAKLGYSVSRPLFLAGKHQERYKISEKVCHALDRIEGTIIINEKEENATLLRAKMLIDDCGWSLYLSDRFENRKAAESRIKEGIAQCLRFSSSTEVKKTYPIVFKGLRHLFGMCIENFDETDRSILQSDLHIVNEYVDGIHMYGGLLGYLLNDQVMGGTNSEERYRAIFSDITRNSKNADRYFSGLRDWCTENMLSKVFSLSTYSFRTKYFLSLIKASAYLGQEVDGSLISYAKELALKMILGYATSETDYSWLGNTITFADEISKYEEYSIIKPDTDRLVKGYLLLGTLAMILNDIQSLEDAQAAFHKAIVRSREVNRTDTYISAQRKLISVNERIFKAKKNLNLFDEVDEQNELQHLIDIMDNVQKECEEYLGYTDKKMNDSCKERRKYYKKLIRESKKKSN